MMILIFLILSALAGAWVSVVKTDLIPQGQLHLVANRLSTIVYEYAAGFLVLLLVLYMVGVLLQASKRYVLNQTVHFGFWFIPLLYVLNEISVFYEQSLLLPAFNIPYYIIVSALVWIAWQTAKFMSSSEALVAFKMRR